MREEPNPEPAPVPSYVAPPVVSEPPVPDRIAAVPKVDASYLSSLMNQANGAGAYPPVPLKAEERRVGPRLGIAHIEIAHYIQTCKRRAEELARFAGPAPREPQQQVFSLPNMV